MLYESSFLVFDIPNAVCALQAIAMILILNRNQNENDNVYYLCLECSTL